VLSDRRIEKECEMAYLSLWVSIVASVAANLLLKEGTHIVGEAPGNFSELPSWMLNVVTNPYTISALFASILAGICITIAMSRLKLSYIMPLYTAVPLIFVVALCLPLFEEKVPWLGWLAIVIISGGVSLVSMRADTSDSKI
jgi:multidrug transporter EmrE-like cation transporter